MSDYQTLGDSMLPGAANAIPGLDPGYETAPVRQGLSIAADGTIHPELQHPVNANEPLHFSFPLNLTGMLATERTGIMVNAPGTPHPSASFQLDGVTLSPFDSNGNPSSPFNTLVGSLGPGMHTLSGVYQGDQPGILGVSFGAPATDVSKAGVAGGPAGPAGAAGATGAKGDKGDTGAGIAFSGCRVHATGTPQTITNNTVTAVLFDTEDYDTDAYHEGVTNPSRLTIPATGYYLVTSSVGFASSNIATRQWRIVLNNTTVLYLKNLTQTAVGGNYDTINGTFHATAGDYIEIQVYQNCGSNLDLVVADYSPSAAITRLG